MTLREHADQIDKAVAAMQKQRDDVLKFVAAGNLANPGYFSNIERDIAALRALRARILGGQE